MQYGMPGAMPGYGQPAPAPYGMPVCSVTKSVTDSLGQPSCCWCRVQASLTVLLRLVSTFLCTHQCSLSYLAAWIRSGPAPRSLWATRATASSSAPPPPLRCFCSSQRTCHVARVRSSTSSRSIRAAWPSTSSSGQLFSCLTGTAKLTWPRFSPGTVRLHLQEPMVSLVRHLLRLVVLSLHWLTKSLLVRNPAWLWSGPTSRSVRPAWPSTSSSG